MGYRKVPTLCRDFCATPHHSHSYKRQEKERSFVLLGTSTRVFAFGEDSFALPLTSELDAIPKKRKTASRMGYRKVPTLCRDFCATPHHSHSYKRQEKERSFVLLGTSTRVFAFGEDSFALPLTSELGLTVVRSRSRENNTQLFSNTLAPLRYALYGENVNRIPCASHCENPIQSEGGASKGKKNGIPRGIPKSPDFVS